MTTNESNHLFNAIRKLPQSDWYLRLKAQEADALRTEFLRLKAEEVKRQTNNGTHY